MRKTKTHTPEKVHDFHMRIADPIRAKLDGIRRKEEDFPSRAEMIRRLIIERAK